MKIKTSDFEFNLPDKAEVKEIDIEHQQSDFFKSTLGDIVRFFSKIIWRSKPDLNTSFEKLYVLKYHKCDVSIYSINIENKSPGAHEMLRDFIESQTRGEINIEDFIFGDQCGAQYRNSGANKSSVEVWFKRSNFLLQVSVSSDCLTDKEVDEIAHQVFGCLA